MSKGFDYSKWDNIELSDDEDDVHPNIERESWFRMKHRSRVEREEREETDKKKIHAEMASDALRAKEIRRTLEDIRRQREKGGDDSDSDDDDLEDTEGLEAELKEVEDRTKANDAKLENYEKNKKWNVDNICQVTEERTVVNPKGGLQKFSKAGYALPDDDDDVVKKKKEEVAAATKPKAGGTSTDSSDGTKKDVKTTTTTTTTTKSKDTSSTNTNASESSSSASSSAEKPKAGPSPESVAMLDYHEFTEQYADVMEHFMTLRSFEKSKQYLLTHGNILLQENSSSYLLLASLEDEMNGFREKMRLTARQSQIISNIVELARSMQRHPGNVIAPFFDRIGRREFLEGFMEGTEVFVQRIIERAVVKRREMDAQREKEEAEEAAAMSTTTATKGATDLTEIPREERLGPGGLDPVEVYESLPESMQDAFESRDTEKLKEALMKMDVGDAERHMKRCVDSGLWNE